MRENQKSKVIGDVIDLARYRQKSAAHLHQKEPSPPPTEALLDTITYHLLMAAKAIAAHTQK